MRWRCVARASLRHVLRASTYSPLPPTARSCDRHACSWFAHTKVEIWDDLGWIIVKGKISPDDVEPALDVELASLHRAAAAAAASTPYDSATLPTPPTLTCTLKSERSPVNGESGRVTFGIRLSSHERISPRPAGCEGGKSSVPRDSQESCDMSVGTTSLRGPVQERDTRTGPKYLGAFQESAVAVGQTATGTSPEGNSSPFNKQGRAIDDIDDLLGFSPHIKGSGSSSSSVGSSASTTGGGGGGGGDFGSSDSGEFSGALGGVLGGSRAAAVDNPLEESWSSAESAGMESARSVILARKPDAPHANGSHEVYAIPEHNGTSGKPVHPAGMEECLATGSGPVDPPADVPVPVSTPGTVVQTARVTPIGGAFSPSAEEMLVTAEGTTDVTRVASGSSTAYSTSERNDGEGYGDETFDSDDGEVHRGSVETSGLRQVFSFSSASSTSSCFETFSPNPGPRESAGDDGEVEEMRRVQRHVRGEMVVSTAAAALRRRLRRAAEQFCGGSSGADTKEGVKHLFNRLDEVL